MRENDPQREAMGKILKSGKVKGFMTIHALLTKDNEIHVFPDAENMPKILQSRLVGLQSPVCMSKRKQCNERLYIMEWLER